MSKKAVLVIATTSLCRDGLTEVLIRIAEQTKDHYDLSFVLAEKAEVEIIAVLQRIGKVYQMPSRKHHLVSYLKKLSRIMKQGQYGIVHIHGNTATMAFDAIVAKHRNIPRIITHTHNAADQSSIPQRLLRKVLNRCVTDPVACSAKAGDILYNKSYFILTNGVDCERFRFSQDKREEIRNKLGISKDAFVAGHIGRFTAQKNQERLIRIFKELLAQRGNAWLLLCGAGEDLEACRQLAEDCSIKNRVFFAGIIDCPESYYSAMDVFVMPSLFEGLPIVGVEAQANGLPCVFSDTITQETKITDPVLFLPLSASDKNWADAILAAETEDDRYIAADRIKQAGFGNDTVKEQIRQLYPDI